MFLSVIENSSRNSFTSPIYLPHTLHEPVSLMSRAPPRSSSSHRHRVKKERFSHSFIWIYLVSLIIRTESIHNARLTLDVQAKFYVSSAALSFTIPLPPPPPGSDRHSHSTTNSNEWVRGPGFFFNNKLLHGKERKSRFRFAVNKHTSDCGVCRD